MDNCGLYIHIPFCASKCSYCDFYSKPCDKETKLLYAKALINNIKKSEKQFKNKKFDSLFIGGGTPSYLGSELSKIISTALSNFNFEKESEISVEVNPESVNLELIRSLKNCGVNRISMGVQSFNDSQLKILGRVHSVKQTESAVNCFIQGGITNFNLDLMFGIPVASEAEDILRIWENTVNSAVSYSPKHISAYSLTLEENTKLFKDRNLYYFPTDEQEEVMYNYLCSRLNSNDYVHYEISNFAKDGYECKHNLKYWEHNEYLGLGPSAHSFMNGKRFCVQASINGFINGKDDFLEYESIDDNEAVYEKLLTGLRLKKGIDIKILEGYYNLNELKNTLTLLKSNNLIKLNENTIALTEQGFRVSNLIINEIDKYKIR